MAEGKAAGKYNSSVTRVWPVLLQLLDRDPSGERWLRELLRSVGKSSDLAASMSRLNCTLSDDLKQERDFSRYDPHIRLPRCLEYDAPAPERFLHWMIRHSENLDWSKLRSPTSGAPTETNLRRAKLKTRDLQTVEEAIDNLALFGSRDATGRGTWWALKGPHQLIASSKRKTSYSL
jgi:hypothetical protein